jgi:hypothetical protein
MCDSFVHTIGGLQVGDSKSQTPIDLNGLLHSKIVLVYQKSQINLLCQYKKYMLKSN